MKKLLCSLLFAACLCLACNASAAVQEFGPDFCRFVIDVKDWNATPNENGALFIDPAKSCSVVIAVQKNQGENAETVAADLGITVNNLYQIKNRLKQRIADEVRSIRENSPDGN